MKKTLLFLILFISLVPIVRAQYTIITYAGKGVSGYSGDGGQATAAEIGYGMGICEDAANNLYIVDYSNNHVRKVTPAGVISTIVGNGGVGYNGDNIPATNASLSSPTGIAVDAAGNLYIADYTSSRVRKVTPAGIITTFAGTGVSGFSGDGGQATAAQIYYPWGVGVDAAGDVYISDTFNHRVRKVNPAGIIKTIAGTGVGAYNGDGIQATAAELYMPWGVDLDAAGDVIIGDTYNNRIRKVTPAGIISTIAGTGAPAFSGDGGQATAAAVNWPLGVRVDGAGNVLIADYNNNRIRSIAPSGIITTIAGNGTAAFCCDGGPATAAELDLPYGIVPEPTGDIYVADVFNYRVRKLIPVALPIKLLSFDAIYQPANNNVFTSWATASEINNKFFTVEKTNDGGDNWQTVATVQGAGNSSQTLNYFATDENPFPGISYYRLKQTDYDGNFTYSETRSVNVPESYFVDIYPNPVSDNLTLRYNSVSNEAVNVRIVSLLGAETIAPYTISNVQIGMNTYTINTSSLAGGMYILVISNGEKVFRQKFVKH